ncbi:L,D-transpeptidase [Stappia stellulata]|uniref:L,D-transpeptidase n=1 Tax=Stappia stellulata TaxID=71235 RepID=UPI001CD5645F|nr:L,D-transpeptidase [Stappia stellulata]MCA1242573.1 L,D-transpeptidase [Stappia stellulata]
MTHTAAPSSSLLTRRALITGAAGLALAGCTTGTARRPGPVVAGPSAIDPYYLAMYAAMPQEKFPIPAVDLRKLDPVYFRQVVDYPTQERAGTLVVDTPNRFLYLVMENGQALRYGVGIGRAGFSWSGRARIAYKRAWPRWTPPAEMIEREPELEKYRNGMEPGLQNPLGARALYIFEGGRDTIYRVHGTMEVWSIGKAVSSGCVRLLNQDIIDLAARVPNNAPIVVKQGPGGVA